MTQRGDTSGRSFWTTVQLHIVLKGLNDKIRPCVLPRLRSKLIPDTKITGTQASRVYARGFRAGGKLPVSRSTEIRESAASPALYRVPFFFYISLFLPLILTIVSLLSRSTTREDIRAVARAEERDFAWEHTYIHLSAIFLSLFQLPPLLLFASQIWSDGGIT